MISTFFTLFQGSKKCSERSGTATTKLPVKNSPLLSSHLNTKGGIKNSNKSAPATPTSTLGRPGSTTFL